MRQWLSIVAAALGGILSNVAAGAVIAHWEFNEKSPGATASAASGAVLDRSGNAHHLTASGSPLPVYTLGAGLYGGTSALRFTSGADQLSLAPPAAFNFGADDSFTLEAVLRVSPDASFTGNIIGRDWGARLPSWWFRLEAGVPRFLISQQDGPEPNVASTVSVADGNWHHVAAVRDASKRKLRVYVDGLLTGEATDTTRESLSNEQNLVVGAFNNGMRQFEGELDLVRVSSGALQPEDFVPGHLAIMNLTPRFGASFLSENPQLTFSIRSDYGVDLSQIRLELNGTNRSDELEIAGSDSERQVRFTGLVPERSYSGHVSVTDRRTNTIQKAIQFDTHIGHVVPVFTRGENGYHTFRIPAILVTPGGALLAICEARKNSGADDGDIDLVQKKSFDGGKTWRPLQVIWSDGENTIGNPCPVVDETTGTIWLPFCRNNSRVFITKSTNDAVSWTEPMEITSSVKKTNWNWYATGPGVGIQIKAGPFKNRLVIPSDHRAAGEARSNSHVVYSDNHGQTWKLGGVITNMNECQAVELADGRLMMNMRNADPAQESRAVSFSSDGGITWSGSVHDPALIEPICQASILRYTTIAEYDRNRLLFSNPASISARTNLTIRVSYDEGQTWPVRKVLHAGPTAYSCLTVLPDDTIGCLYEAGVSNSYETVTFARFSLGWLSNGTDKAARRRLQLKRVGSDVSLTWPAAFAGDLVESSSAIGHGSTWSPLSEPSQLVDDSWISTVPIASTQQFFRLKPKSQARD